MIVCLNIIDISNIYIYIAISGGVIRGGAIRVGQAEVG